MLTIVSKLTLHGSDNLFSNWHPHHPPFASYGYVCISLCVYGGYHALNYGKNVWITGEYLVLITRINGTQEIGRYHNDSCSNNRFADCYHNVTTKQKRTYSRNRKSLI
jgi:hypothetical protein